MWSFDVLMPGGTARQSAFRNVRVRRRRFAGQVAAFKYERRHSGLEAKSADTRSGAPTKSERQVSRETAHHTNASLFRSSDGRALQRCAVKVTREQRGLLRPPAQSMRSRRRARARAKMSSRHDMRSAACCGSKKQSRILKRRSEAKEILFPNRKSLPSDLLFNGFQT